MFDPMGWQDSRTDQIWDQILALRSCSLMPLPKLFNTPQLQFLPLSSRANDSINCMGLNDRNYIWDMKS